MSVWTGNFRDRTTIWRVVFVLSGAEAGWVGLRAGADRLAQGDGHPERSEGSDFRLDGAVASPHIGSRTQRVPLLPVDADRTISSGQSGTAPPQKTERPATGAELSLPANAPHGGESSPIAGVVLPIKRAEELLLTLPGVVSARIVAGHNGAVDEIHLLTSDEVQPKATVRNVESALLAHLGMRVSHKKISVAITNEPSMRQSGEFASVAGATGKQAPVAVTPPVTVDDTPKRRLYFEDVEVRRSRTRGVACRVTLRKGEEQFVGESEGLEGERQRIELASRAALAAIASAESGTRILGLEGCKVLDAFERQFVFVGVSARYGRDTQLLTGSAEVKESPEQSAVLAVLDATNRWMELAK
jgi:hypothetical protein